MSNCSYLYAINNKNQYIGVEESPYDLNIFDFVLVSYNTKKVHSKIIKENKLFKTAIRSDYNKGVERYNILCKYIIDNYDSIMSEEEWANVGITKEILKEKAEKDKEFFEELKRSNPKYFHLEAFEILEYCDSIVEARKTYRQYFKLIMNIQNEFEQLTKVMNGNDEYSDSELENMCPILYEYIKKFYLLGKKNSPNCYYLCDALYYEID